MKIVSEFALQALKKGIFHHKNTKGLGAVQYYRFSSSAIALGYEELVEAGLCNKVLDTDSKECIAKSKKAGFLSYLMVLAIYWLMGEPKRMTTYRVNFDGMKYATIHMRHKTLLDDIVIKYAKEYVYIHNTETMVKELDAWKFKESVDKFKEV